MGKSKIDLYEDAFVRQVDVAINEVAEATNGNPGPRFIEANSYKIEFSSVDNVNHTLVFYNSDDKIIAYVDYRMGVGIVGYDLADLDEQMYFDLAGCLLSWQCEVMYQINSK